MTIQISQRGKEYLETARTLLRAQTMTDRAIAGQLEALAVTTTSSELRKLRMTMRPRRALDRLLALNASGDGELHSPPFLMKARNRLKRWLGHLMMN